MRERLSEPENTVVRDFLAAAGLAHASARILLDVNSLMAGLRFLEQVNLFPVLKILRCNSLVINGTQDNIVPMSAGKTLADAIGARFAAVRGGHAFFTGSSENEIGQRIGSMPEM
jgi:pimeloyl-ACP methyl ester carboxylesterase